MMKVRKKREKRVRMRMMREERTKNTGEKMTGMRGNGDERAPEGGSSGSLKDGHTCLFILPNMWTVNDFKPTMTTNIFKNLRDRFQIPNHIPIVLPDKFEKCYSGKIANVGMYDAMFAIGLRLPLTTLHRQLDYPSAKLLPMLGGYSLVLKSYRVVLMVGTVSLH